MVNEKLKREYVVPEMRIKRIDFSDILTNSPEGQTHGQTENTSGWSSDPFSTNNGNG